MCAFLLYSSRELCGGKTQKKNSRPKSAVSRHCIKIYTSLARPWTELWFWMEFPLRTNEYECIQTKNVLFFWGVYCHDWIQTSSLLQKTWFCSNLSQTWTNNRRMGPMCYKFSGSPSPCTRKYHTQLKSSILLLKWKTLIAFGKDPRTMACDTLIWKPRTRSRAVLMGHWPCILQVDGA